MHVCHGEQKTRICTWTDRRRAPGPVNWCGIGNRNGVGERRWKVVEARSALDKDGSGWQKIEILERDLAKGSMLEV